MPSPLLSLLLSILLNLVVGTGVALGQEALFTESATQPSPGTVLYRQQTRLYYGRTDGQLSLPAAVSFGVWRRHSVSVATAGNFGGGRSGLSDVSVLWKWRLLSVDSSPLNTSRTALIAGLQIPSGGGAWSTGSFNPSIGVAHTSILGRLGLGGGAEYKFNTGDGAVFDLTGMNSGKDALKLTGSVLWRVFPQDFGSGDGSHGALYTGAELELIQSGGGSSFRLGPSVMYEAETWVIEAGWQFYPVNTGGMEQFSGMIALGFRLFF